MKASELASNIPKTLIYAPAGKGKTALAMTLGERGQLCDLDGNIDVAFGLKDNLQEQRLSIDVIQFINEDPKSTTAFPAFKKHILDVAAKCKNKTYPFDALVVDSLTSLSVSCQQSIMGNSGKLGQNPQIQHWGLILTELINLITIIKSLPIRVFLIAHETTFVSDDITQVQIAIPGQKLPGQVTRLFSEIWYLRIKSIGAGKSEMYIQTSPSSSITCRSGRGLQNGFVYGTIDKDGNPGDSVGLWDILSIIEQKELVSVNAFSKVEK